MSGSLHEAGLAGCVGSDRSGGNKFEMVDERGIGFQGLSFLGDGGRTETKDSFLIVRDLMNQQT